MQEIEELQHRESTCQQRTERAAIPAELPQTVEAHSGFAGGTTRLPVVPTNPTEALKLFWRPLKKISSGSATSPRQTQRSGDSVSHSGRATSDRSLFDKERYAIQSLVDQSDWLRQIEEQIRNAEDRSSELRRELNHQMTQLGSGWSVDRLNSIDTSPAAHHRLLAAARRYQDALQRRGKLRRWLRSMTKRSQKELVELNAQLDAVGIPVSEAIDREQSRLKGT
jgi:hypothetical protein